MYKKRAKNQRQIWNVVRRLKVCTTPAQNCFSRFLCILYYYVGLKLYEICV